MCCKRKTRFLHKYAAFAALRRMIEEGRQEARLMLPYECKCGRWHLGHPNGDLQDAMKKVNRKPSKLIKMK